MESNMQIHFIFSNDFFDVIVKSIDEAERLSLMKIPNMLIVKELFNSPCSTLREYFRQMEIDLDRAEEEMNNYLEAYVEKKSERKVKPKSTKNDKIKVTKKGKIKITKNGYFFDMQIYI